MGDVQTDEKPAFGKRGLIAASILCAVLLIASFLSLSRVLNKSSPHGSAVPPAAAGVTDAGMPREEIAAQDEMAEEEPPPPIQTPAAVQPAVSPAMPNKDAIKLQEVRAKVNKKIVKRLKQYIKDHPDHDNRDIEDQIKKRENRASVSQ